MTSSEQFSNYLIIFFGALSLFIAFYFNGTGGEADSYHHHLIAYYSFQHPNLFFDHWGKPIYTLLSSPFAQLGFMGSKLFNVVCSLISMKLAYEILKREIHSWAIWIIPIFFLIPLNFKTTFSSFTEPLFGCILLGSILLAMSRKMIPLVLLVSLLPLIRSEGLLFLGLFGIWLIYEKKYIYLPLLLSGQLFYDLAGMLFLGKDFLWIFFDIPYASTDSHYGSGPLLHFVEQLFYICGPVLLGLFILGLVNLSIGTKKYDTTLIVLLLGGFFIFLIFHSLSWYLGMFNSMGLTRVFGAITPLMAMIMVFGLVQIKMFIRSERLMKFLPPLLVTLVVIMLFSAGPSGIKWKKEMNLSHAQQTADQIGKYLIDNSLENNRLFFSDRYLSRSTAKDLYDANEFQILDQDFQSLLSSGDLLIWDNWHSIVDFGLPLERLNQVQGLNLLHEIKVEEAKPQVHYVVFEYKADE